MINGTYNILYLDFGTGFFPIGLLESNGFSEEIDFLDSTTRDNAGWKTQTLTTQSYNIDFSGIVMYSIMGGSIDTTKIGYDRIQSIKRTKQLIDWKTINSKNGVFNQGKGQIISLSEENNIDEFVSFSASIKGYGATTSGDSLLGSLETQVQGLL